MSTENDSAASSRTRRIEVVLLGLILLLGLLLRLRWINEPPVDFLSWRDTQTLMVARNFYREGMNLFSPSVDWRTTTELAPKGTVGGTELQVVPYLTAILYFIFGIQYWVGRVVPIAFALLGTFYFHRLVRRFYGPICAPMAALFLTVSPYFEYCGRVQMPEPFAFAMAFAALYYFDSWIASERRAHFAAAAIFSAMMLLGKPQLGIIVLPMAFIAFQRFGWSVFRMRRFYLFAVLVGASVTAYMAYSFRVLVPIAGLSFGQSSLLDYRKYLLDPSYYSSIAEVVWLTALTPPITVLAALGIFVRPKQKRDWFVYAWTLAALAFFFLMPGGNIANGYYHMMLAPPAVILASRFLALGWTRRRLRIVVALIVFGVASTCYHSTITMCRPYYLSALHCGTWIREHTPPDTRVLTADRSPTALYFADRVGWTSWLDTFGPDLIDAVIPLGASILAVSDVTFDNAYYPEYGHMRDSLYDQFLCYHGDDFAVFSLKNPADLSLPDAGVITFGTPDSRKYLRGTWGPNQMGDSGDSFVAMGPAPQAAITFTSSRPVQRLLLTIAAAVSDLKVTITLNGQDSATLQLSRYLERGTAAIECPPSIATATRFTLTLAANRQTPYSAASLLLYALKVETAP